MSRVIDTSKPEKLSDEDKLYLQERDRLPEGVEPVAVADVSASSAPITPNTGDANTLRNKEERPGDGGGYAANSTDELKDLLRERGLKVSGSKDELIARLEEDDDSLDEE